MAFNGQFFGFAAATSPANDKFLTLRALPPSLPTNSSGASSFPALVVSITDAAGNPIISRNTTVVYLSSSQSAVLTVQPNIQIKPGDQYVIASVTTTETPGNSTVTAVSPGFESASVTFHTYTARGYPTQLQVYPLPASFTAGQVSRTSFVVMVLDGAGLPARAIATTAVQLTSSNTTVASVGNAQIPANGTLAYGPLSTSGAKGVASITASAPGFVSSTTLVNVVSGAGRPVRLAISAPSNLPADGGHYDALTVSLLDNQSRPAAAVTAVQVLLTSSRTDIASMGQQSVSFLPGQSFQTVMIDTSSASGSSFVTASALNYTSTTVQVNTVSIPPTKLQVYLADDRAVVSPISDTLNFVIQLQDNQGVPAEARNSASVIMSFSNKTLMQSPLMLTIAKGSDLVYGSIPLSQATEGTLTAISNGLYSSSVDFSAAPVLVTHGLSTGKSTIYLNQTSQVYFYVQVQGLAVSHANVTWYTTGGSLSSYYTETDSSGSTSVTFIPSSTGLYSVTAAIDTSLSGKFNASVAIVVIAYPAPKSPTILSTILSYLYYIIAGAAAAVVAAVFLIRRRRRRKPDEDEGFDVGGPDSGPLG